MYTRFGLVLPSVMQLQDYIHQKAPGDYADNLSR